MEGMSLVGDSTLVDHSIALETALSERILVARDADVLILTRNEALISNRLLTHGATETFLVPLLATELKLLHSSSEDVSTTVTACSKVVVMAVSAVQAIILAGEWLIYQRVLTVTTFKTHLMPMFLLVGQVLGVSSNRLLAFLTGVGKEVFIALDTEGMFFTQDVAMSSQRQVTVPAGEVLGVEVLLHSFTVTRVDQRSGFSCGCDWWRCRGCVCARFDTLC